MFPLQQNLLSLLKYESKNNYFQCKTVLHQSAVKQGFTVVLLSNCLRALQIFYSSDILSAQAVSLQEYNRNQFADQMNACSLCCFIY